jgi:hypothetical protein
LIFKETLTINATIESVICPKGKQIFGHFHPFRVIRGHSNELLPYWVCLNSEKRRSAEPFKALIGSLFYPTAKPPKNDSEQEKGEMI